MDHDNQKLVATISRVRINPNTFVCQYSTPYESFTCDNNYEVLIGTRLVWKNALNGSAPDFPVRIDEHGHEQNFIGRLSARASWKIGTVKEFYRRLFFSILDSTNNQYVVSSSSSYQTLCQVF